MSIQEDYTRADAIERARRAKKATGYPHYIYQDTWGEWTYAKCPIANDHAQAEMVSSF